MTRSSLNKIQTPKDLTKLLTNEGYVIRSNGGSHLIASAKGKPSVSFPTGKIIAPGTLRNIKKTLLGKSYYEKE